MAGFGDKIRGAFGKAKNRADNGNNYDVMNPEAENPDVKSAKEKLGKASGKVLRKVGQIIAKGLSKLFAFLISNPIILGIAIVIYIVITIVVAHNKVPGMMTSKLKEIFNINIDTKSWFTNGAVGSLDKNYDDIISVANYLEEMNYSLIGDGFVTPVLKTEGADDDYQTASELASQYDYKVDDKGDTDPSNDVGHYYDSAGNIVSVKYYNNLGQLIDNTTGEIANSDATQVDEYGIIRSTTDFGEYGDGNRKGKVAEINKEDLKHYRLLRSYLLSNYRIYNLKNADQDIVNQFVNAFKSWGGNQDAWATGLIKLYNAKDGIATNHWWWGQHIWLGEVAKIDGKNLTLKKGWFNNEMSFSIEGWAPRYGMSLEFLLSLHLGTHAPDLVNAMLQNFDTEVQVYLDAEKATIDAKFTDGNGELTKAQSAANEFGQLIDDVLQGWDQVEDWDSFAGQLGNIGGSFLDFWSALGQDMKDGASILRYGYLEFYKQSGISSPDSCEEYVAGGKKCSEYELSDNHKMCDTCTKYMQKIRDSLDSINNDSYEYYQPYIARVLGSWFRDTYFVVPREEDEAIREYSGGIKKLQKAASKTNSSGVTQTEDDPTYATNHPEFDVTNSFGEGANFVKVDEAYLADSDEYWTAYETKDNSDPENEDYQLYVLKADGKTSNTKMEDFLANGVIDGEQATLNGNPVTGYSSKKEAEKDGWAFVKKAITQSVSDRSHDSVNGDYTITNKWEETATDEQKENLLWTAYNFNAEGSASDWTRVTRADENQNVNDLYDIMYGEDQEGDESTGVFYQFTSTNAIEQVEDAQRGETNSLVKYLFKYRQFYIYDGGEKRGVQIEQDKQRVLYGYTNYINKNYEDDYYKGKVIADKYDIKDLKDNGYSTNELGSITKDSFYHYKGLIDEDGNGILLSEYYGSDWRSKVVDLLNNYGRSALRQSYSWATISDWIDSEDLAEEWLDWQLDMFYMDKFGVDLQEYYHSSESEGDLLKLTYDPRDPDLIDTVEITKSSLNVFSILENTGTLDAEYAYRDFKELIVELDYFDRSDLSSKKSEIFTWILPDVDPTGWPNLPWDKQNVNYGTLMQSHKTYESLGVDYSGGGASAGAGGDTSNLYWIGDSWTVGLVQNGLVSGTVSGTQVVNDNVIAKIGANAYSLPGEPSPKDNATGIVIALGKNDPGSSGLSSIESLIEKLTSKYPAIPIYVLKLSYYGTSKDASKVDSFNSSLQSYCNGKTNVKFVDPTGTINDNSSKTIKSNYNASDNLHLNAEGYKAWYQDIISAIGSGAKLQQTVDTSTTSSSTSTNTTSSTNSSSSSSTTASSGANSVQDGTDPEHIITFNGVQYSQWNQSGKYGSVNVYNGNTQIRTDSGDTTLSGMGCGIYSSTALMSAYVKDVNPQKTCEWLHNNIGTSAFNNDGSRNTSITTMLTQNGISGNWVAGSEAALKEAFSAGKPMIVNVKPGSRVWTTKGGHFICFCGVSQDGKVYTADSVSGGGDRLCHDYGGDFDSAVSKLWSDLIAGGQVKLWIPDKAPDGSVMNTVGTGSQAVFFQGFEADQNVASPVTGKILEIGKYPRLNIYTGEYEDVEFITIKVMDSDNYFDSRVNNSVDYGYEAVENEDGSTEYDTVASALNLFYKEYSDVCDGYTITIDGIDVDLSVGDDEGNSSIPGNNGAYEENEVSALYNSKEETERKNREKAKANAPFFINYGMSDSLPGDTYVCEDPDSVEGYYVKEGKFIGKTITKDEELVSNDDATNETQTDNTQSQATDDTENQNGESSTPDKLTYTYEDYKEMGVTGDYIRIQVKDTDMALVDDVETFFDIPEPDQAGGTKFGSVNQEYQAQSKDLEVLAEVIYHESGGWEGYLSKYNVHGDEEAEFNGYCMGYSVVNKLLEQNKQYYGMYYDESRTDMSPLVQVVTNQKYRWYGGTVPQEAMKVYQGGKGCYSDKELEFAEFCLKYDSTSVTKKYETVLGSGPSSDGYSATQVNTPIPRAMCQQGGYGDGASGQSGIILVGFEDINKNGYFDKGDELFGVDRSMESLINN